METTTELDAVLAVLDERVNGSWAHYLEALDKNQCTLADRWLVRYQAHKETRARVRKAIGR